MHALHQLTLILATISNTALAILLLRKTSRTLTTISFVIFLMLINIWALPYIFLNNFNFNQETYDTLIKIASLGFTLFASAFLVFALSFTNRQKVLSSILFWTSLIISCLEFLYLNWATEEVKIHSIDAVVRNAWGNSTPNGPSFPLFIAWLEFQMLCSFYLIVKQYFRTKDPLFKKQNFMMLLAISFPMVLGSATDAIAPIFQIWIFPMAIPLTSVMAITITVAFLKYGLFDLAPLHILTSAGEGIISLNQDGHVSMTNKAAQLMLGLPEAFLVGRDYQDILRFEDAGEQGSDPIDRPLSLIVNNNKPIINTHLSLLKQDGTKLPVSMIATPIKQIGRTIGATIILRDISQELEAQKQRENFLNFAGHEIKTPFTSIKLYASMVEKYIKDNNRNQALAYTDKIQTSVDKLSKIVDQLSDLTLLQNNKLQLAFEKCSLQDVINDSVEEVQNVYSDRLIQVRGDTTTYVLGDKIRLEQVLINLLTNAIKYSPTERAIVVNIEKLTNEAVISVVDQGQGIDIQDHEKIFQSFFRVDENDNIQIPGMGIGLYLVKKIINLHKGKVWVRSNKGEGSTFFFSLPLANY